MENSSGTLVGEAGDDLMGHKPSDRFGYPSDAVRAAFIKWQQAVEALGPNPLYAIDVPPVIEPLSTGGIPLALLREMGDDGPSGDRV